jgi:hypothetical protein
MAAIQRGTRIACTQIVATTIQPAREIHASDPFLRRESVRLVGALVALLASTLLATGGLLWREHARAHAQSAPAAAAPRR